MQIMVMKKNTATFVQLLTVLMVCITTMFFLLQPANAQVDNDQDLVCPIQGFVSVYFEGTDGSLQVGDIFSQSVVITNDTNYTFGDVRIAVAVYETSLDTKPSHWSLLSDIYQINSGMSIKLPIEIDMSVLPAGEHLIKIFAVQGDAVTVLGHVMNGGIETTFTNFYKNTVSKNTVDIDISLDENRLSKGVIYADIITTNKADYVLRDHSVLSVIALGDVPLGAAIWVSKVDKMLLVPTDKRKVVLQSVQTMSGFYTIYATLVGEGVLNPIVSTPVQVGEKQPEGSWPYLSKIGLTSYPLLAKGKVVTCVNYVGKNKDTNKFLEPLVLEMTLTEDLGLVMRHRKISTNVGTDNYFSFTSPDSLDDFDLSIGLFHQRFPSQIVSNSESERENVIINSLSLVQTITQSFSCGDYEFCYMEENVLVEDVKSYNEPYSFWFYFGITLSSLLLMYLMLVRLGSSKGSGEESDELSKYELQ